MAQGKKSFVLYTDLLEVVEELSDEEAGQLFKTILRYVNDKNPEVPKSIKLAFIPIRQDLKRDLEKYEAKRERFMKIGKQYQHTENEPNTEPHDAVFGGVNDNVNVNVNGSINTPPKEINKEKVDALFQEGKKEGMEEEEINQMLDYINQNQIKIKSVKGFVKFYAQENKKKKLTQKVLDGFKGADDEWE